MAFIFLLLYLANKNITVGIIKSFQHHELSIVHGKILEGTKLVNVENCEAFANYFYFRNTGEYFINV